MKSTTLGVEFHTVIPAVLIVLAGNILSITRLKGTRVAPDVKAPKISATDKSKAMLGCCEIRSLDEIERVWTHFET